MRSSSSSAGLGVVAALEVDAHEAGLGDVEPVARKRLPLAGAEVDATC
jgi:hypothetical protein